MSEPFQPPGPPAPPTARTGRRTRRSYDLWILFGLALVVMTVLNWPASPPPGWAAEYDGALREATRLGKPLLVGFYLDGCVPCKLMDRTTLRSEQVVKALGGFVPVRLNLAAEGDLAARLGVVAAPTYVALDPTETPLGRFEGSADETEFLRFLAAAQARRH